MLPEKLELKEKCNLSRKVNCIPEKVTCQKVGHCVLVKCGEIKSRFKIK